MTGAGDDTDDTLRVSIPGPAGVGSVIAGGYRIVAPLDEGGVGTVWLAEYGTPPTRVAVKLLRPQYAGNAEVVARFEREAGSMAGLVHENIARAFDFGKTASGELYMVMEYVEGESLRAALNRAGGTLPLDRVVTLAKQMSSALSRAHSVGVVHRDLKPENVIVADAQGAFPRLKILDFGMARVTQGMMAAGSPLTRVGSVFGTPAYMPPEQATAQTVDARADQYALGVMLYEMLAGRRPFVSDSPLDLVRMHVRAPVPPLIQRVPTLAPGVAAVIERMLAKHPAQRFADVATAITALCDAAAPVAPPPPAPSRRPVRAWVLALAVLALIALTAVVFTRCYVRSSVEQRPSATPLVR